MISDMIQTKVKWCLLKTFPCKLGNVIEFLLAVFDETEKFKVC